MNAFLVGLLEYELVKDMDCTIAKAIWKKMRSFYEGKSKVRKTKLQGFKMKFESIKMHEDDEIAKLFLQVDDVVNKIIGLDEKLDELVVVQKVLRSLPKRFNAKVSTIGK